MSKMHFLAKLWYALAATAAAEIFVAASLYSLAVAPVIWLATIVPICLAYAPSAGLRNQLLTAFVYDYIWLSVCLAIYLLAVGVARAHVAGRRLIGLGDEQSLIGWWEARHAIPNLAVMVAYGVAVAAYVLAVVTIAVVLALQVTQSYGAIGLAVAGLLAVGTGGAAIAGLVWVSRDTRAKMAAMV